MLCSFSFSETSPRPPGKDFEPVPEVVGTIFNSTDAEDAEEVSQAVVSKEVSLSLQSDIASLAHNDSVSDAYTREVVEPRLEMIRKIHAAVLRETRRERNLHKAKQNALKSRLQAIAPPLSPASKLAISAIVRTVLLLVKYVACVLLNY